MKNTLGKTLFILLLTTFTSYSQEIMNLEKAIRKGIENNYGIKIDETQIQIAENNNTWARAGRSPIVDLNVFLNNNVVNDNNQASFLQGTYYSGSLGANVSLQWVLLDGGRVAINKEQLGNIVAQQRLQKSISLHELITQITQQYYDVLYLQEQNEVLQQNLDQSKTRLEYELTKKSFGATNSYNIVQFENAVISDSLSMVNQIHGIELAKRNLYTTLYLQDFPSYVFPERLSLTAEEIDGYKLKELLSEENYTLKSLEMISSINRLNTKLQEVNRKPIVSLSSSIGVSENAFQFFADNPNTGEPYDLLFSNRFNGSLGLNMNWNIIDGGIKNTNIQNARLQEEMDKMSFLQATAELHNQLDLLIANYTTQKEILKLAHDQLMLMDKNLQMTEERFKSGQMSSIDFRNIQNQKLAAAFQKVTAMYNLISTKNDIDYLVGRFN